MPGIDITRDDIFENGKKFHVNINHASIREAEKSIIDRASFRTESEEIRHLILAIRCIDLTTLAGDDTYVNVERICCRALEPLSTELTSKLVADGFLNDDNRLTTGAVCVYPAQVDNCRRYINRVMCQIPIASVATGFPSGQYSLETRLIEIKNAVNSGASEIDIVINRSAAIDGDWRTVYDELMAMRVACGKSVHMKAILEVGELISYENVYIASMAAMKAGADFIKTSTGKVSVNATIPYGLIMTRAICDFHYQTGKKIGFKPAGGLRTARDAVIWLQLIKDELGEDWLKPDLFRIGASSLLNDLQKRIFALLFHRAPTKWDYLNF